MSDDPTLTLAAAATEYAKSYAALDDARRRHFAADEWDEGTRDAWIVAYEQNVGARRALCRAALVANGVEP